MQPNYAVDPHILQELRSGERLLWWAQPNPRYRASRGRVLANTWILWTVIAIAVVLILMTFYNLFLEIGLYGMSSGSVTYSAVFVLLMIIIIITRLPLLWRKTADFKNTVYAITNARIIVITAGKQYTVNSHTKEEIGRIDRVERPDGWGDVVYGPQQWYSVGYRSAIGQARLAGIPNVRDVEALMIQTFKNNVGNSAPSFQQ